MSGLTIEVLNLDKVTAKLTAALGPGIEKAVHAAAQAEARIILPKTQEQVPVDIGSLKSTGRIEEPPNEAGEVTVAIAYGGMADNGVDVDYALQVHEDLEARHPHGKAKYVEDPIREELTSGRSLERIVSYIDQFMDWEE